MEHDFKTIDDGDIDDFILECEARGMDPEEFQLEEHDVVETELTPTTVIMNGRVTVRRGDVTRTYATGDGMDWLVEVGKDLRKGIFS